MISWTLAVRHLLVRPGRAVVLFACISMTAAGAVLVAHDSRFLRAAAIQAVPPLVAIVVAIVLP